MSLSRGLITYAVLHHVLAASAILSMGAADKIYSHVLALAAFAFLSVIVRRGWQVAESPDMSPGKAQGFLFIPFFNYYWIFRAFPGVISALSARGEKSGVLAASRTSAFALTCAILFCLSHLAWLLDLSNVLEGLLYAVYAGFSVVVIWQVITSVKALEPSTSQFKTMSPVAVSAIVLGPIVVVLAAIPLLNSYFDNRQTAEVAMAGVAAKGYECRIVAAENYSLKEIGVAVWKVQVVAPGNRSLGQVFYVEAASVTVAQRAELDRFFGQVGERSGPNYYYKATRTDTDQQYARFKDWVASF